MRDSPDPKTRYLVHAARRFAEAGFHGVSLAAVAADAGVTKQALLHYFGSKEKLYAEVLARLANRLCKEIDVIEATTPAARLAAYFEAHVDRALAGQDDAHLVIRALLDSRAGAGFWPLKPYLDKLTALALETRVWANASPEQALAGLYQLIGAIQYLAISQTTLTGMYGRPACDAINARARREILAAIHATFA